MRGYLLSIKELISETDGYPKENGFSESDSGQKAEARAENLLLAKAFARVDADRRKRASGMKPGRGQAACLGAGLLLQLAVAEAMGIQEGLSDDMLCSGSAGASSGQGDLAEAMGIQEGLSDDMSCSGSAGASSGQGDLAKVMETAASAHQKSERNSWKKYTVGEMMALLEAIPFIPLEYVYGDKGKPYLKEYPFFFSISHSGEYVLCVLSRQEIGADIQQHRRCDIGRLAERFFSERERSELGRILLHEERAKAFYRLWARKEAYGKLTGGGIGDTVGRSLLPGEEDLPEGRRLIWEEVPSVEGYSAAVCRRTRE